MNSLTEMWGNFVYLGEMRYILGMNLNQITHAQDAIQRTINQNGSLDQKISAIKSIILELLTTRTEYFFGLQN